MRFSDSNQFDVVGGTIRSRGGLLDPRLHQFEVVNDYRHG
jgi:hypothetical protein